MDATSVIAQPAGTFMQGDPAGKQHAEVLALQDALQRAENETRITAALLELIGKLQAAGRVSDAGRTHADASRANPLVAPGRAWR